MVKSRESHLAPERFRILAINSEEQSYFVVRIKNGRSGADDYCWCIANYPLEVGKLIDGYLSSPPDVTKLPTLVIGSLA